MIRYSQCCLFERRWYLLKLALTITSEMIADNVTAAAMPPKIIPINAPMLIASFGEAGNTVYRDEYDEHSTRRALIFIG